MFKYVREKLDCIIDSCNNMSDDNIVKKLLEIRVAVAEIKLELEELEFQNSED